MQTSTSKDFEIAVHGSQHRPPIFCGTWHWGSSRWQRLAGCHRRGAAACRLSGPDTHLLFQGLPTPPLCPRCPDGALCSVSTPCGRGAAVWCTWRERSCHFAAEGRARAAARRSRPPLARARPASHAAPCASRPRRGARATGTVRTRAHGVRGSRRSCPTSAHGTQNVRRRKNSSRGWAGGEGCQEARSGTHLEPRADGRSANSTGA